MKYETQVAEAWRKAPLEVDGHTIFMPERYVELGYPEAFVEQSVQVYKSDLRDPKSTITKNGRVVKRLTGVYHLSFLYAIANEVGADQAEAARMNGRGFQAAELVKAINDRLKIEKAA